ncbi:non-ribosomal peptide synthetase [Micromonospora sp. NPDC048930]|uniref:non-ribosomal peptide synthetase n=1 Tax=Micromonospora sp. NPDC048930 TaxID=3364261 RepID=UPI00371EA112
MTATATAAARGRPTTIPAAILRQAEVAPDQPAVVDRDGALSYRDLVDRAAALAAGLQAELDTPDRPAEPVVAVLQPRTAAVVVAHLAAWLGGAAFLPLDAALPAARLAQILAEADCRVALADESLVDRLPDGVTVVRSGPGQHVALAPADRLAYVISTSGSTGRPKQVEVEHGSLVNTLDWYAEFFRLGPGTRTAAFAGLAFDACLLDLWAPLMRGATVLLADETVVRDPDRIAATLREVDHCFLATPLTEQLLRSGADTGRLRSLATGGDRLRVWPPADFGAAVHNLYGPTEATILVTATDDLRRDQDPSVAPPIGRPVAGARLLLDPPPARPGDPGELLIAGPVLARGYRTAPAETAAAFVTGPEPSDRHYRTGDICGWTDRGELSYVGRTDGQVKIRGNRVELREIELALLAMPGITQAAADVLDDADTALLATWVVGPVDADGVRAWLRERLPASMVPHRVDVLAALPLTVNGKLDRAALRAAAERRGPQAVDEPPATDSSAAGGTGVAGAVAAAWQAVLGVEPGPDDDFFLAGGDSLLAVRLTTQVRRGLDVQVRSSLLYEHRRFADYLAAVTALHAEAAG